MNLRAKANASKAIKDFSNSMSGINFNKNSCYSTQSESTWKHVQSLSCRWALRDISKSVDQSIFCWSQSSKWLESGKCGRFAKEALPLPSGVYIPSQWVFKLPKISNSTQPWRTLNSTKSIAMFRFLTLFEHSCVLQRTLICFSPKLL